MEKGEASRLARRARIKVKRELLRVPVIGPWSDRRYSSRIERNAGHLPRLNDDRFEIFAELRDNGIAVRDGTAMISPAVIEVADRFADRLREIGPASQKNSGRIDMPEISLPIDMPGMPVDCATAYKWGLAEANLDLAERYIGLPVFFVGAAVRRERVDGPADFHTRRWHRDIADRRMLKIIVYLNDVEAGCGAFEHLGLGASDRVVRALRYSAGHLADSEVARIVDPAQWLQVIGPRLTTTFVDTARMLHRAQPPATVDRYSLTLAYVSTTPLYETFPEFRLTPAALANLCDGLTPRQRRAVMMVDRP